MLSTCPNYQNLRELNRKPRIQSTSHFARPISWATAPGAWATGCQIHSIKFSAYVVKAENGISHLRFDFTSHTINIG